MSKRARLDLLVKAGFAGREGSLNALFAGAQAAQALRLGLCQLRLCSPHLLLPCLQLLIHLLRTRQQAQYITADLNSHSNVFDLPCQSLQVEEDSNAGNVD